MLIGVGAKHAKDELREFIETCQNSVIHSLPAKTILPDDGELLHIVSVT